MTRFVCGSCAIEYDRKHAPRHISAAETSYPISLPTPCTRCNEVATRLMLCLGCALETNQCQGCRHVMHGENADLLMQVRQYRERFNLSLAAHRTAFTLAIAGFKEEVDEHFSLCVKAEARMKEAMLGLNEAQADRCYTAYLDELKALPFAHRAEYEQARDRLEVCLQADRELFDIVVTRAFALSRLHSGFMGDLARVVSLRPTSFLCDDPPDPIDTVLSDYVMAMLTDKDRLEIANQRRRSFEVGKNVYHRLMEGSVR